MRFIRIKGILAWLLTLMLVCSFLGACSRGGTGDSSSKGSESAAQQGSVKPAETKNEEASKEPGKKYAKFYPNPNKKYKITKAGWLAGPVDNQNGDIINYLDEKLKIRVEDLNIDGSKYNDILNIRLAANDIPDFFSYGGGPALQKFKEDDIIFSYEEDMFAALAPDLYNMYSKEVPGILNFVKVGGDAKISALPQYKLHSLFYRCLVWRNDWLKNVGITKTPDTLEEVEAALYKFAKEDPDRNGKNDTYGINKSAIDVVYGAYGYMPGYWVERDGKLVYGAVQPEMKEALAMLQKWYKDGVIDPEFITGENKGGRGDITHVFINGRIGLTTHAEYFQWSPVAPEGMNLTEFKKANPSAQADAIVVAKPPIGKTGKRNIHQALPYTTSNWFISKKLEKSEPDKIGKIFQLVNFFAQSYDNYLIGWYGLQGKHWELVNGEPMPIGKYIDKVEQNRIGAYTTLVIFEPYEYWGKLFQGRTNWAKGLGLNEAGVGIKNLMVAPLPSRVKYETEMNKIMDETYTSIIIGDKPVSYFDDFVKKWRSAGGDSVEKEAQKWYEDFKKNSK